MIHRALNIPMNSADFTDENYKIRHSAKLNGFTTDIVDKIPINKQGKLDINKATKSKSPKPLENKWASIQFVGPISFKISKILKELGIKM
jgi:hypothetical protein